MYFIIGVGIDLVKRRLYQPRRLKDLSVLRLFCNSKINIGLC